ncbi:MAG: hypothetical protein IJQ57_07295 [Synergistaceae bacterium]|nr:hypothetical protein [Synergistaceae bacterium]
MFDDIRWEFCGDCKHVCEGAINFTDCWKNYGDECPFHDSVAKIEAMCNKLDNMIDDLAKSTSKEPPEPMTREEYEADYDWYYVRQKTAV